MRPSLPAAHACLAIEAELPAGPTRFVRERLRLPMGIEASFGWLRHPPSVLVVPRRADGRLLVLRRYRPAVGRWLLEFPSGVLAPGESPGAGAGRLLRQLTGHRGRGWQALGVLRPNPGYSDECMTLGLMESNAGACPDVDHGAAEETGEGLGGACAGDGDGADGGLHELRLCTPEALHTALGRLAEPLDGRSVSAWFLASRHWSA